MTFQGGLEIRELPVAHPIAHLSHITRLWIAS